jgi:hypothetical protein
MGHSKLISGHWLNMGLRKSPFRHAREKQKLLNFIVVKSVANDAKLQNRTATTPDVSQNDVVRSYAR